jgi:hypothetical protein
MKKTRSFILFSFVLISVAAAAQQTSVTYQLNGRMSNKDIENSTAEKSKNPFVKFVGEWTLKNDDWTQNWGNGKEMIKIPHHHTVSSEINTDLSLLSIIDGPQPNGHIFWSFDPRSEVLHHLSSFGTARSGVGKGTVNKNGDLSIKVSFSDEAKDTYRLYTYKWINNNEYELMSIQYDGKDKPTGLFYGGTFVRIKR